MGHGLRRKLLVERTELTSLPLPPFIFFLLYLIRCFLILDNFPWTYRTVPALFFFRNLFATVFTCWRIMYVYVLDVYLIAFGLLHYMMISVQFCTRSYLLYAKYFISDWNYACGLKWTWSTLIKLENFTVLEVLQLSWSTPVEFEQFRRLEVLWRTLSN